MKKLIPIINELQRIFAGAGVNYDINLPQIVVVGSQSCGKSSVLESIVGKDFLPRGEGIVTRAPAILQLHHLKDGIESEDYAVFSHLKKRFTDFDEVRHEIEARTNVLAKGDREITSTPIILEIYSTNVLDLTLVDLPGLTKVPIGDQPKDIDQRIRKLVTDFVKDDNCIILAVSQGNIDLANSDSLQLAREVDPKGKRTIGVITKLDLAEDNNNIIDVLIGKLYPLELGYVGVKCRPQKDIDAKKPLSEALRDEKRFFERAKTFASIKDRLGIQYLSRRLNKVLNNHIEKRLPSLRKEIENRLKEKKDEIASYGPSICDNPDTCDSFVFGVIEKFVQNYKDAIEGTSRVFQNEEYKTGARIKLIFTDCFSKELKFIDPLDRLTDEDIRTAIANANGLNVSLFIPEAAFETLTRKQIKRLSDPSLSCALQIHNELKNLLLNIKLPELKRFEKLKEKIIDVTATFLRECLKNTEEMIRNLIEVEIGYINTNHPDVLEKFPQVMALLKNLDSEQSDPKRPEEAKANNKSENANPPADEFADLNYLPDPIRATGKPSSREKTEVEIIKQLMKVYFDVLITRVADMVPKIIVAFLIEKSLSEIHLMLIQKIKREGNIEILLAESSIVAERRRDCNKIIKMLTESQKALSEFKNVEIDFDENENAESYS